jgi:hypothetical protein
MVDQDHKRQLTLSNAIDKVNEARAQLHAAQLEHQRLLLSYGSSVLRMPLTRVLADDYAQPGAAVDSEVERAYRRGFAQGAAQTLYAMEDGASLATVTQWVWEQLWPWRGKVRAWSYFTIAKDPPRRPHNAAHNRKSGVSARMSRTT